MCVRTSTHIYLEFSFSKKESHCNIWSNYKLVKEQRTKTTSLSCINVLCARIKKMPKFHAFLITSLYAKLFSGASSLIFSWLPFKKQGIIAVNPPELWPVCTLPTRGIKLITLPACTSIRYPPVAHLTLRR